MGILPACICAACTGQKAALDSLGQELQKVVSHHVCDGKNQCSLEE